MLLAALVVGVARAAEGLDDGLLGDAARALLVGRGGLDRRFERRERDARVAARGAARGATSSSSATTAA